MVRRTTLALVACCALATPTLARAGWAPVVTDQREYSVAIAALAAGRLDEAEAGFTALLDDAPDCGMARHGRGMARLRAGNTGGALDDLQADATAFPDRPEGHTGVSVVRFSQQDFAGAESAARAAIAADSGDIDAQSALQQVLLRTGDLGAASAALASARESLPGPIVACFEVHIAQEAGDAAKAKAALDACRRSGVPALVSSAVSRSAGDAAEVGALAGQLGVGDLVLQAQAVDLFNDGDFTQAAATLDTLLARSPHRVDARLLRARARHALGRDAEALSDLEAAFDGATWIDVHQSGAMSGILRKSDAEALAAEVVAGAGLIVQIKTEQGQLAEARQRLEALEAKLGSQPAIIAAGARLLRAEGDGSAAWARVEAGLQAHPRSPTLLRLASEWSLTHRAEMPASVATALGTSNDWTHAWNTALGHRKAGDLAQCTEVARTALHTTAAGAPPDVQRKLAGLAHRCAVTAGDLDAADPLVGPAGGPDALDPTLAYNHARLRHTRGDASGARALLGRLPESPPTDQPEVARAVVALAIRADLDRGAVSTAADLAEGPWSTPKDRMVVASRLAVDGQDTRANTILTEACPMIQGEARPRCDALLEATAAQ